MTDTFSTPAEHAFEHDEIEAMAGPSTMGDATEELSVEEAFEVVDTINRIREGGFKTVSYPSCSYSPRIKKSDC
jgi:diphthamide biosynthesis protein 2